MHINYKVLFENQMLKQCRKGKYYSYLRMKLSQNKDNNFFLCMGITHQSGPLEGAGNRFIIHACGHGLENTTPLNTILIISRIIYRTAAIQERVTAVLRSIPIVAFADSFQKLYERCQPCSCEGWRLF
jgi:hypothetical protein